MTTLQRAERAVEEAAIAYALGMMRAIDFLAICERRKKLRQAAARRKRKKR